MSRLQDLCKERGFTQIKMQMLIGIDQSAYSKIERGERYLSFEQCRRVALALNTSMDYLAGLTDETAPVWKTTGNPGRKGYVKYDDENTLLADGSMFNRADRMGVAFYTKGAITYQLVCLFDVN